MKKITIKEGSKASPILKELAQEKEKRKKATVDRMPPKEVAAYISKHTGETAKLNEGKLDKESFRLGMYAMWFHLNDKPITGEDVAALLHRIHTHAGSIGRTVGNAYMSNSASKVEEAKSKIYYAEEDLLPVLEALGLPAPIWGKSMSIKEWKKSKK